MIIYFVFPFMLLVIGVAFLVGGEETKVGGGGSAMRIIGVVLIFLSLVFIAGCFAMTGGLHALM